jgi:hypothetical protein
MSVNHNLWDRDRKVQTFDERSQKLSHACHSRLPSTSHQHCALFALLGEEIRWNLGEASFIRCIELYD